MLLEDLRDWFGTGKKGGAGGGGWDRYNTSGERIGKCGDAKEGEPYAACLSKEKARKLGKAGRAAFVKRKRAAQKKGGDAKKGGEHMKGQKPIKVKTEISEQKINLFLEKNIPTQPDKWAYAKAQAKKKFDVYPSAYANAWAAKKYKQLGGKWKTSESALLKLESDLLSVSKPYELQIGDTVRNINPKCKHYKSVGTIVAIQPDGDITYKVDNQGATYTPGDVLTKTVDQLLKVFTHTPRPGYGMFSNE